MRVKIILLLFCFSTYSCLKKQERTYMADFHDVNASKIEQNINLIDFDNSANPTVINVPYINSKSMILELSQFVDSISYIALSNSDEATLGGIDRLEIQDSIIYILDRYKTKSLKAFDMNGKFLYRIGSNGEGPGEYTEPTDFMISENEIIIFDQFQLKLIFFDLKKNFKYSKKVPFLFLKFYLFSPNDYVYYSIDSENDHLLSITDYSIFKSDSNFILKNKAFYRPKNKYISFYNECNFTPSGKEILYHYPFDNTIFSLNNMNQIHMKYSINFKNKTLPKELLLQENESKFKKEVSKGEYLIFSGSYYELENYFYFLVQKENMDYHIIYNKEGNNLKLGNLIKNDIIPILPFMRIKYSFDNTLVGYFNPHEIIARIDGADKNDLYDKLGEKSMNILSRFNMDDNPYLVFFNLKKTDTTVN